MGRKRKVMPDANLLAGLRKNVDDLCRQVQCKLSGLCCDMESCTPCNDKPDNPIDPTNPDQITSGEYPVRGDGRV